MNELSKITWDKAEVPPQILRVFIRGVNKVGWSSKDVVMGDLQDSIVRNVLDQKDSFPEEEPVEDLGNFNSLKLSILILLVIEDCRVIKSMQVKEAFGMNVQENEILKTLNPSDGSVETWVNYMQSVEICIQGNQGVPRVQIPDSCIN